MQVDTAPYSNEDDAQSVHVEAEDNLSQTQPKPKLHLRLQKTDSEGWVIAKSPSQPQPRTNLPPHLRERWIVAKPTPSVQEPTSAGNIAMLSPTTLIPHMAPMTMYLHHSNPMMLNQFEYNQLMTNQYNQFMFSPSMINSY